MAERDKRYRVFVRQKLWQTGEVIVTAADEDEAWGRGYELAERGDDAVCWHRDNFDYIDGEVECDEVEEVPDHPPHGSDA